MEAPTSTRKAAAVAAIILAAALTACSHKRTAHIERTHADTIIYNKEQEQTTVDTLRTVTHEATADTLRESLTTFAIIDSTGRLRTAYVWHTRQTTHSKGAKQAAERTATTTQQATTTQRQSTASTEAEQVTTKQTTSRPWRWAAVAAAIILAAAAYLAGRRH